MDGVRPKRYFAQGNSDWCIVGEDGLVKHVELHVTASLQEGSSHSNDAEIENLWLNKHKYVQRKFKGWQALDKS